MKNVFLDLLQANYVQAEKRFLAATAAQKEGQVEFQAATQKFQQIQVELGTANSEFNSLKILIAAETRKLAAEQAAGNGPANPNPPTIEQPKPEAITATETTSAEINKTELIRDLLRSHPTGMTPVEIWRTVKDQVPHRAYVYAVLGRLKDRDQVTVNRKGKYFFRISHKSEEAKPQTISVQ